MEATDALKKLADAANKAAEALSTHPDKYDQMITTLINQFKALGLTLQESMALAAMSARYQAQADAIAGGTCYSYCHKIYQTQVLGTIR
jgi:hypothetical protein